MLREISFVFDRSPRGAIALDDVRTGVSGSHGYLGGPQQRGQGREEQRCCLGLFLSHVLVRISGCESGADVNSC